MKTIEFFHDTICSFCFPMSYKMRQVSQALPEVQIVHRSFALVRQPEDFDYMFQSRQRAKEEVLHHWEQANLVDPLHRFNIEGMRKADFLFPISMPALKACKAAYFVAGDAGYWDLFDALQDSFFVRNLNIQEESVLAEGAKKAGLDVDAWQALLHTPKVEQAVQADLALAQRYGIHEVPTLVVNGKTIIRGALPQEQLLTAIQNAE